VIPLLLAALLGAGPVPGTVDRIEGDWAVVEWPAVGFLDVPTALFSRPPREGAPVRLWALAHPRGTWRLDGDALRPEAAASAADLQLPAPAGLRADRRYLVVLAAIGPLAPPALAAGPGRGPRRAGGVPPTTMRTTP